MTEGALVRRVTKQECPWLEEDLETGKVVYKYYGCTYYCITPKGIAVTNEPDKTPFYEIPRDSVVWKQESEEEPEDETGEIIDIEFEEKPADEKG